jgi:N-methylhydantoinase A
MGGPDPRPLTPDVRALKEAFEAEHERLYGHRSDPDNPVEVVALRLVGRASIGGGEGLVRPEERLEKGEPDRQAHFGPPWGTIRTPVVSRRALSGVVTGPLLIDEYDSTTVVPPGMRVHLDDCGNIVMQPI